MSTIVKVTVSKAGSPGLDGKTAYQYAVESGYTGTEQEFAEDQANFASNATQVREDRDTTEGYKNESLGYKNDAEDARDDAEEAKNDTEDAKIAAETAQGIAEGARDTAVSASNTAVSAKNDAVEAKGDAENAKTVAESARDTAVSAKNDAVSAKNDAESAKDTAVLAANTAVQAKEDALLAQSAAESARDTAVGARNEAVDARNEAEYFAYLTGLGSPLWYGVEWDITIAATELTRIGNLDMHRELPIQNNRFGCVLKDDGTINYKLHPNNWAYQFNGQPSTRDGTDGQVGIWQNEYWVRCETEGNIRRIKLSPFALPGYFRVQPYFRGAYEAAVHRPTNKLASVANDTPDYRGGNNNAAWDGDDRSLLGVPASNLSRMNFQAYARNRGAGWEMEPWWIYLSEWWLYLIEYANRNCQSPFNATLTIDGFRQGGLGEGVTNINNTAWNTWKSQYGFVPCGYTDEFGIYTGVKSFELPAGYGSALTTYVPRWRGIENPFGHLWKWVNGINFLIQADGDGGKSYAYRQDDPSLWSDANVDNYVLIGEVPRVAEYINTMIFGESGDLLPSQTSGSSSTFWADRWYTSLPSSGVGIFGLRVGGASNLGANVGFGCFHSGFAPSTTHANLSSRLCFLPEHPLLTP